MSSQICVIYLGASQCVLLTTPHACIEAKNVPRKCAPPHFESDMRTLLVRGATAIKLCSMRISIHPSSVKVFDGRTNDATWSRDTGNNKSPNSYSSLAKVLHAELVSSCMK